MAKNVRGAFTVPGDSAIFTVQGKYSITLDCTGTDSATVVVKRRSPGGNWVALDSFEVTLAAPVAKEGNSGATHEYVFSCSAVGGACNYYGGQ